MKHIYLIRDLFFDQQASLGTTYVYDGNTQLFKSDSLERGWVDNKNRISCLPVGDYPVVLEMSGKFESELWEIKESGPRSECKFHIANFWFQLNGCIALGYERGYADGDPVMDVLNSADALDDFHAALYPDRKAMLHIRNILDL